MYTHLQKGRAFVLPKSKFDANHRKKGILRYTKIE